MSVSCIGAALLFRCGGLPATLVLALLAGCAGEPVGPSAQAPEDRSPALSALEEAGDDLMTAAFESGLPRAYTRTSRTEVRSRRESAATERTVRIEGPGRAVLVHADTSGSFRGGLFGRRRPVALADDDLGRLLAYAVPRNPPYLDERYHEAFVYEFGPDTLLSGRETAVLEIRAHPTLGASQPIRHVRHFVDRPTGEITAIYVERAESRLFVHESSRFFLRIRPGPRGRWVPYQYRLHTTLKLPLHAVRTVRTAATYYRHLPPS